MYTKPRLVLIYQNCDKGKPQNVHAQLKHQPAVCLKQPHSIPSNEYKSQNYSSLPYNAQLQDSLIRIARQGQVRIIKMMSADIGHYQNSGP